ncbi:hypothetical protein [Achromobacter spanius]|uniref:hypothetical protein n=1 Tax=Achromobacter spanius TaxID=217203 RepID=UPI0038212185
MALGGNWMPPIISTIFINNNVFTPHVITMIFSAGIIPAAPVYRRMAAGAAKKVA